MSVAASILIKAKRKHARQEGEADGRAGGSHSIKKFVLVNCDKRRDAKSSSQELPAFCWPPLRPESDPSVNCPLGPKCRDDPRLFIKSSSTLSLRDVRRNLHGICNHRPGILIVALALHSCLALSLPSVFPHGTRYPAVLLPPQSATCVCA